MQKHYRFARHGSKYPKRQVITTHDPGKSEAFYHTTDADAPLGPRLYAAGIIQHPTTKLYQVWVSTNGFDVTCLSAHRDEKLAEADKQEVKALISSGDLYNDEKLAALFQKLRRGSEEEPSPLPNALVRHISREIVRAVVDRPPHPS